MNILPFDKQVAVIAALCEGVSIRSTERLTGVHRDTIMRLGMRVGFGCDTVHDRLMRNLRVSLIELDELWAFVGKKQKRVTADDMMERGDFYTFLALDSTDKAILSYRTGKRDVVTTELFVNDLKGRVIGAPVISSDAWGPYQQAVCNAFAPRLHYGRVVKTYSAVQSREAAVRYSPGDVVAVRTETIYGSPATICTSHVERVNLSVRMASRRFGRLTNAFSKRVPNHAAAVSLFVSHYNLCRVHETIKTTPAVALGVADHVWSVAELIEASAADDLVTLPGRQVGRFRIIDGDRD